MITKNLNHMIDFLCQIKILQLKMLKLLKIPGFSIKIPGFFKNFPIPGFPDFQVKWQPWTRLTVKNSDFEKVNLHF